MTIIRTVAQVFTIESNMMLVQKLFDLLKKVFIQGGWAPNGKRKPMTDEGVAFGKCPELAAHLAANAYPVLWRYLQKIHRGTGQSSKFIQKTASQTQACTRD
jgi:hypothetical protein